MTEPQVITWVDYDATGKILLHSTCGVSDFDIQQPVAEMGSVGMKVVDFPSEEVGKYYIDTSTLEILDRPSMGITIDKTSISADGVDKAVISGVPDGASLGEAVADGTDIEFITDQAGLHEIYISLFPYQDEKVEIHAT